MKSSPFIVCVFALILLKVSYLYADFDWNLNILTLENTDEVLAPQAFIERVRNELTEIYSYYPAMSKIKVIPSVSHDCLSVELTEEAMERFKNGKFYQFDSLNSVYGLENYDFSGGDTQLNLYFSKYYNTKALGEIYMSIEGVRYAFPEQVAGIGDNIFLTIHDSSSSHYRFQKQWHPTDNFFPWLFHHWGFNLKNRKLESADHHGDPLLECDFTKDSSFNSNSQTVHFIDMSFIGMSGETGWSWDFDNDGLEDSKEQHPVFKYSSPGTYDVRLTITNDSLTDSVIKNKFITINDINTVSSNKEAQLEFELHQNRPNPFSSFTQISYTLSRSGFVTLKIHDLMGRKIQILVNTKQKTGEYTVPFNARELATGLYFYELEVRSKGKITKKMLLQK